MGKTSQSQWDFGELFPSDQGRRVFSVAELTDQIKRVLEKQVGLVWVSGEITNLRTQASGHIYFTLKDAEAQLACVLFRGETIPQRELLRDGQKVLLQGEVTVYAMRGQYQLRVRALELQGIGALQLKFEQLKQRLAAEGLFAAERKQPLPPYPQRIGLVTSLTGAAIRDVFHVVQRRFAGMEVILAPCRVQGEGAAEEIAQAIGLLNEFAARTAVGVDLILLTRGGGSLEDLWAFNEEVVARAIFASDLPVVSAIGHEIDYTIADFVADVRAATPSAAAELITARMVASRDFVAEATNAMQLRAGQQLTRAQEDLESLAARMTRAHPQRRIEEQIQRLDDAGGDLARSTRQGLQARRITARDLAARLAAIRVDHALGERRDRLHSFSAQLRERAGHGVGKKKLELDAARGRLNLLNPKQVLARGYSITLDAASGEILRAAARVKPGQRLRTKLATGEVHSRVEK
jgi:exodeoxyribonuclease VII large subunit